MKPCSKCGSSERYADGRCGECARRYHKVYDANFPGKRKEHTKAWTQKNRKKHNEYQRKSRLLRTFGISAEDYNVLLNQQDNACGICGVSAAEFDRRLAVDHDHSTGKVRGLLCGRCNRLQGLYEWAKKGAPEFDKYLQKERFGK